MISGLNTNAAGFAPARGLQPVDMLAGVIAGRILASYAQPLGAGQFAQALLPKAFNFQGLRSDGGASQKPDEKAQWSATVGEGGKGSVDLGDGYTLELNENNSEITIKNANTGETTQIWGDPHVNVDGQHAFDFWGTTTFKLENGTKITIDTEQFAGNPDMYVASGVTVTKGNQAIQIDGISQNELGDLSITQSMGGRQVDAQTRDGFVLRENATGSGWRSQWTGDVATQDDLNATRPGAAYGPGSTMPSLNEIGRSLTAFLLLGAVIGYASGRDGDRAERADRG